MPSTQATVKISKEKEQKQQHVSVTEIILMTSFIFVKGYMLQKVLEISTRSKHTRFTAALHGIPNILGDSWNVSHPPTATQMREMTSSTEWGSCTSMSSFDPSRINPDMTGPAI
ncbi:hypothetical protein AVEN_54930-1 [Araneus ventricosus]|uniref:Uncharacterized protein n=1 Tax=Araneus ventricosus TaxID=182803 RepID=A0A4Y2NLT7_ARAVE|nr:hypothetical protein AVEN_54930-1 [Araneus ventricosus]